ncbi:MAG: hypothetical protein KTR16_08095 [Acidiferrobacterales bacterium]|nr:hypothetical protein [Acidiferrobacterales bacterium]
MKQNQLNRISTLCFFAIVVSACGGGGDTTTGSGGAPLVSSKCSITGLAPSSGSTATLSKSSDQLTASFNLIMNESSAIETSSNFENAGSDDWIEGVPIVDSLSAGSYSMEIVYDLNSPSKTTADVYTKLSLSVILPGDEACIANETVNISLNP